MWRTPPGAPDLGTKDLVLGLTLEDALELTLARKKLKGRRPKYLAGLRQYLRKFIAGREKAAISEITTLSIEEWFIHRKEAASSQRANLGRLSSMFDVAWRAGHIEVNPCKRVEQVTVELPPPSILSLGEIQRLLEVTRPTAAMAYLVLTLFAGLRPEEAMKISWSAIDLKRGTIRIDPAITKVRSRRIVHVMPAALEWIRSARDKDLPLSPRQVRRFRKRAREALGFDKWPHDVLRHTCASFWLAEWRDAGKVAHELGNSAPILERHYKELVSAEDATSFWALRPVQDHQLEFAL